MTAGFPCVAHIATCGFTSSLGAATGAAGGATCSAAVFPARSSSSSTRLWRDDRGRQRLG